MNKTGIKIVFNPENKKYEAVKITDEVIVGYCYTLKQVDELKDMLIKYCGENIYFVTETVLPLIDGK